MRRPKKGRTDMDRGELARLTLEGREKALAALEAQRGPGKRDRDARAAEIREEIEGLRALVPPTEEGPCGS